MNVTCDATGRAPSKPLISYLFFATWCTSSCVPSFLISSIGVHLSLERIMFVWSCNFWMKYSIGLALTISNFWNCNNIKPRYDRIMGVNCCPLKPKVCYMKVCFLNAFFLLGKYSVQFKVSKVSVNWFKIHIMLF